jgi:hypothetical protein
MWELVVTNLLPIKYLLSHPRGAAWVTINVLANHSSTLLEIWGKFHPTHDQYCLLIHTFIFYHCVLIFIKELGFFGTSIISKNQDGVLQIIMGQAFICVCSCRLIFEVFYGALVSRYFRSSQYSTINWLPATTSIFDLWWKPQKCCGRPQIISHKILWPATNLGPITRYVFELNKSVPAAQRPQLIRFLHEQRIPNSSYTWWFGGMCLGFDVPSWRTLCGMDAR